MSKLSSRDAHLQNVALSDKYELETGRIYLTGIQALVRLPIMQAWRDRKAGLNTGGFISGYRGSPLGGLDDQLWRAENYLKEYNIRFEPGVNEELGATAVWGSQQVGLWPGAKVDGVFGMWYGKGPGVDRSMDAIRHANAAGTAPNGGVLALLGDDTDCKSSAVFSYSEATMKAIYLPTLFPADVKDVLEFGLYGWAMSRFTGAWVGLKCLADNMDASSSVRTDPLGLNIVYPEIDLPPDGLHIRRGDIHNNQEARLLEYKIPAMKAFARANNLNPVKVVAEEPRIGIIGVGKAYNEVCAALETLGIPQERAEALGISIMKLGLVWPLDEQSIMDFARGLDEIIIVEEKNTLVEEQVAHILYRLDADKRPVISGKTHPNGEPMLRPYRSYSAHYVADHLAKRLLVHIDNDDALKSHAKAVTTERSTNVEAASMKREAWYCSGCPHNRSTKVPDGSRAFVGIGCHYMVQWMDRNTDCYTQMGGEGANWVGQEPFTDEEHVFVNLGDGTYVHSGILAIRQAVAANATITYKLLYNDAVAMTGGQPAEGNLSPKQIVDQLIAEGVETIRFVTDNPDHYQDLRGDDRIAKSVPIIGRERLDEIQKELREVKGVSVILYEQTCAAEKRRRRKKGKMVDPARRAFINSDVCEGCGDCGDVSGCVSILPFETELGRKRQIDQSNCNKDFSCVEGFCPSFVTIEGGGLRAPETVDLEGGDLPEPTLPDLGPSYDILLTGVGGTGVITIGAILGMAAHLEGKGVSSLDQIGLAQKGGAVSSHIRIAETPEKLYPGRISRGHANVLLGCDLVTSSQAETLALIKAGYANGVVAAGDIVTGRFTENPDMAFPDQLLLKRIEKRMGKDHLLAFDAAKMAVKAVGDAIGSNMIVLGAAWQNGWIPLSKEAIFKAVELNGVQVEFNKKAFNWGRAAAHDLEATLLAADMMKPKPKAKTLEELIEDRAERVNAYQNDKLEAKYRGLIERVVQADKSIGNGDRLSRAVTKAYHKLLTYKDEYEVARLYMESDFFSRVERNFDGKYKVNVHLAPPILAKKDKATGHLRKRSFGPWVFSLFKVMAKLKGLRGTAFDIFGYTSERRMERQLIKDYEALIDKLLSGVSAENYDVICQLAELPLTMRGFGHVKEANIEKAKLEEQRLLKLLEEGTGSGAAPQKSAA